MCKNHYCEIIADFTKLRLSSQAAITMLFQTLVDRLILISNKCLYHVVIRTTLLIKGTIQQQQYLTNQDAPKQSKKL